jgi:hypothetical protein
MVRLVSAMLVASTILRRPAFAAGARHPVTAGELAVQRQHVHVRADVTQHALHAADLAGAGRNTSMSPRASASARLMTRTTAGSGLRARRQQRQPVPT